jgi:hypothetical protein
MNTGLQDAYNLAWKLALVVRGCAEDRLLDSYHEERRAIAQNLVRSTDRAFALLVSDGWLAGLFRTRIVATVAALAMRIRSSRALVFRAISQIGIRYRESSLSVNSGSRQGGSVRAGDRFPWLRLKFASDGPAEDLYRRLDDTRFNLVLIGQAHPGAAADRICQHVVTNDPGNDRELARAGIAKPAYFLLRPDGHVGLAGALFERADIDRYFRRCAIHLKSPSGAAASDAQRIT